MSKRLRARFPQADLDGFQRVGRCLRVAEVDRFIDAVRTVADGVKPGEYGRRQAFEVGWLERAQLLIGSNALAVTAITGIGSVSGSSRKRRHTSAPLISGNR